MGKKALHALPNSATLVDRNGKITATIKVNGRLFKIKPLKNGTHMATEFDENNLKPDHPPAVMAELECQ